MADGPFGGVSVDTEDEGPSAAVVEALNRVHALGFGLDLAEDLDASLEIRSGSNADARDLYDMLNGLLALARLAEPGDSDSQLAVGTFKSLLDQLDLRNEGRIVTASLSVPRDEIQKALNGEPGPTIVGGQQAPMILGGSTRAAPEIRSAFSAWKPANTRSRSSGPASNAKLRRAG